MNLSSLFKIKFAYKAENEKREIEKKKLQVMAYCANYTEAESLAMKLIEKENMAKYECDDPEIIRSKTPLCNVLLNDSMTADNILLNGLSELFFENDGDALFIVKVKIFTDLEKGKSFKTEYILPSTSGISAINYVKKYLLYKGYRSEEFQILSHSIDATESLYLTTESIEQKMETDSKIEK